MTRCGGTHFTVARLQSPKCSRDCDASMIFEGANSNINFVKLLKPIGGREMAGVRNNCQDGSHFERLADHNEGTLAGESLYRTPPPKKKKNPCKTRHENLDNAR